MATDPSLVAELVGDFVSVPFVISSLWGTDEARGLVASSAEGLTLEFQIHEIAGQSKSGVEEVTLPLKEVVEINLQKRWFATKLQIKTKTLKALEKVPGSKQGEVFLSIASKDVECAKRLVSVLEVRLSERELRQVEDKLHRLREPQRDPANTEPL